MNIFGLIATIIVCGTVATVTWLITRKPLSFRIIHGEETLKTSKAKTAEAVEKPEEKLPEVTAPDKDLNGNNIALSSMDAVIQAANELMGIETLTKEDVNGRKE